ncbi:hypothetical protein [Flavobacterium sp. 3HN19-14]|uniref:hypothetical protein n=1 Tax=Flavobacterium sp. 3HN19-14 TaxID=3448133 RepID=UPI003EDF7DB9
MCPDGYSTGSSGNIVSMTCENGLDVLMADMLPSGQYGIYPSDIDNEGNVSTSNEAPDISTLPLSVYNESNSIFALVKGIDPAHCNWRYPHYFDKDGILNIPPASPGDPSTLPANEVYKHYYNELGEIDYVPVTWDEETSTFSPKITYTSPDDFAPGSPNIVNALGGKYRVEPQFLANVDDFIQRIASHHYWAQSLVKYHPEFHYLDYVYAQCKVSDTIPATDLKLPDPASEDGEPFINTAVTLNSDGFDSLLGSLTTFNQALESGLLNNELALYDKDPFFQKEHPLDGSIVIPATTVGPDGTQVNTSTEFRPGSCLDCKAKCHDACPERHDRINRSCLR